MSRNRILASVLVFLIALLVVAWIANFFGQFGIGTRSGPFDYHYTFRSGNLNISRHDNSMIQGVFWRTYRTLNPKLFGGKIPDQSPLSARLAYGEGSPGYWFIEIPIPLLITALLPLLVGSLTGFRFRLWQFFAFTALVAVELAWFLRR